MSGRGFSPLQRGVHWLMAVLILAMLFIGVAMVASASSYVPLVAIHRPLGLALLLLVVLRIGLRWRRGAPPLPVDLPAWQKAAAHASHLALYALMLAMPLLGWAMLSAAGYPVVVVPGFVLPPILPVSPLLYALLRAAHGWLGYLLFLTVLLHLGAALFHALVRRDGVFSAMVRGR
ncbi:cytochrome b/b6 domain-containing protein [Siccirubricoccus sp. KC 17139]|uniref:Cytochrome b/b6 domain-containing protein n=1 Tax=Siccirubricoccus soli TaxID=2899147 RepID=A0ABT1D9D5_9PROT|nr:cytochrome b/b6 domain-containing protein [Siccirubricoccus soli]MCO6418542.1 cytochrome b/b6 domain-containing protein [Siccirubricoccus soli]MCP2684677.1 cytochrome b/b6 domain-containing protein [Siccirubricoccus soli]